MSLINNVEPEPLPTVLDKCECFLNATEPAIIENVAPPVTLAIFRLSYMWYSFFGCALTIVFGLVISKITEKVAATRIFYLTQHQQERSNGDNGAVLSSVAPPSSAAFNSFTADGLRKAGDQTTAISIVENYRKKPQIHTTGFDNAALKVEEA